MSIYWQLLFDKLVNTYFINNGVQPTQTIIRKERPCSWQNWSREVFYL